MGAVGKLGTGCVRIILVGASVLVILLVLSALGTAPLQIIWHLASGWVRHPTTNLPHLNWNAGSLFLSLLASAGAVFLLHRLLRSRCSLRQTLSAFAILLSTSAAAVAMTGIVHELAWLARSPVTENRGRASQRTVAISNGKQCWLLLIELASEGIFPVSIEELASHLPTSSRIWTYQPTSGSPEQPFVLLRPGEDILELPPHTPVLAAFGVGDRTVLVRADGATDIVFPKNLSLHLLPKR